MSCLMVLVPRMLAWGAGQNSKKLHKNLSEPVQTTYCQLRGEESSLDCLDCQSTP